MYRAPQHLQNQFRNIQEPKVQSTEIFVEYALETLIAKKVQSTEYNFLNSLSNQNKI